MSYENMTVKNLVSLLFDIVLKHKRLYGKYYITFKYFTLYKLKDL